MIITLSKFVDLSNKSCYKLHNLVESLLRFQRREKLEVVQDAWWRAAEHDGGDRANAGWHKFILMALQIYSG